MAGPTAAILLRDVLTPDQIARIRSDLAATATSVQGDDFWIAERPFLVGFGPDFPAEIGELAEDGFPEALGWMPRDLLLFAAMCNEPRDHRILAELCLRFARQTGRIVDFGGCLSTMPGPNGEQPSAATVRHDNPGGLQGTLLARTYETDAGGFVTTHYGDATFVESWLGSRAFHMVK